MAGSILHFPVTDFDTYENFRDHVVRQVTDAQTFLHLVYQNMDQAWVEDVCSFLEESLETRPVRKNYNKITRDFWLKIMPTEIHDCHQAWHNRSHARWLLSGQLTLAESDYLKPQVGTTINFVGGPYGGSRKEPDLLIRPDNRRLPSMVFETGWSESMTQLQDDMNLWLVGGNGDVKLVFILKWRLHNDHQHVSGSVKVYGLDPNGIPIQYGPEQIVFPEPANGQNQVIQVTRRQLFAGNVLPGSNPNDTFEYSLDRLRDVATDALTLMGLVPA